MSDIAKCELCGEPTLVKGRFENDELEYDNGLTGGENFTRMLQIAKNLTRELDEAHQEIGKLRAERDRREDEAAKAAGEKR